MPYIDQKIQTVYTHINNFFISYNFFTSYLSLILFQLFHNFMVFFSRYRVINDRQDKEPYMERYYLFIRDRTGFFKYFPFNIMLHRFLKSDPDDLHDHPWPYCSIILRGGYWEHTLADQTSEITTTVRKWWGPGSIRFSPSTRLHRIELSQNAIDGTQQVWTLFIPGIKIRDWGFITPSGWINNEDYLNAKKHC